ncbi:hypothetical protein BX600DRAFT_438378 [Xylariales sp. PMI_506]|nr:hypothetical protein BX600DRAFT_438378 [Xylariales sp. PMI_506]
MHSNNLLLAAGVAAVASAHVSPHGGHARFHNKRDAGVALVVETVYETVTVTEGETATQGIFAQEVTTSSTTTTTSSSSSAQPTTSSSAAASSTYSTKSSASSSASSSSSSGVSGSVSVYTDFSCTSSKRATAVEIAVTGNVGTPYGCNMLLVDSSIASQYSYAINFENVADEAYEVICWNKYGSDGLLDGWYVGKGQPITFTLAAGSTQAVAFQADSIGACATGPGSVPIVTKSGTNPLGGYYETDAYAGSWVEFDFGDSTNSDWSGFDASTLLAQRNGMDVYGLQVCSADCSNTCSTIISASDYTNAYTIGSEDEDGIGGNCPETTLLVTAKLGYSG